ncbi:MAG: 16S rRNA (guanine(527)-N(7))-methyltransferase RsmG [Mobiluncus porci]|uniref:16S rRNA (guanine(527)-N(7))-methyltransferase RsmG n=2 Tax=Mobiluncus TaxID=2050 RepID=UPI0023F40EF7|nr:MULTISPECIES: 16S rRNA (guanine(527)-N(7))-methyltransferase RsmG [Mobiluncus]MCI6583559.1 16S rRNA (guanine(527)-N(7))-methyltransferase RsmG [Mobiluncus sp.]MDD7540937.1 16S rRNA (guanine(527)-N(7))-methyltransferase RsmG [Mobiluncus porci]MDY5748966.1 16S rRNA (guanine(527)-N(7))-methyltransferase RsmG [Mobiluncus porci]
MTSKSNRFIDVPEISNPDGTVGAPEVEVEPEPSGVADFFDFATNGMRYFVDLLVTEGMEQGLLGPREAQRIWSRHILNCAVLGQFLPEGVSVADVGSGAGLPGLVLAIARPDLEITLIESMDRRCRWLEWVSSELDLDNVRILQSRAEYLKGRERFEYVTARAVGNLTKLLPWVAPLVKPKGQLLLLKGQSVRTEIDEALGKNVFRKLHLTVPEVLTVEEPVTGEDTRVVKIIKK